MVSNFEYEVKLDRYMQAYKRELRTLRHYVAQHNIHEHCTRGYIRNKGRRYAKREFTDKLMENHKKFVLYYAHLVSFGRLNAAELSLKHLA